jgi:DNA-binding GntR family transcriptional regulator
MDATAGHASAAERVYQHVRAGILNRRFADNDLLAEGRIADETGVSRTPVREALLRLEAEGTRRAGAAGRGRRVAGRAGHP